jgi:peptidoglycan/LPS O-acetylase OafA/YrhL
MISLDVRIAATGRFPAFDLLRLAAASAVLFSHVYLVTGRFDNLFDANGLGLFAVNVFFVISGFLIAGSWTGSGALWPFMRKRILRIFPGLAVVVLLGALVLGPALTSLPLARYFSDPRTWHYLRTALLDQQHGLPGVFDSNPHAGMFNGSLWTLSYEFAMYCALASCGVVGGRHFRWLVLAVYLLFLAACIGYVRSAVSDPVLSDLLRRTVDFGSYFFGGAVAWCFRERVIFRGALVLAGVIALILRNQLGADAVLWNLVLPYAVLWLGLHPMLSSVAAHLRHDYSYGVYIWAFPIQQMVVGWLGPDSFVLNLVVAGLLTGLAAYCSWHWVERPFLRFKPAARPMLLAGGQA